jgi:multiple sugar transport system ATP-binding protein
MLEISHIGKHYGEQVVLDDISIAAAPGEFLTLLGPSGCGKSTLLRLIAGLDVQDTGSISIGGALLDGQRPSRRNVAMVFQSYALYPHMTVAQNIALPLIMRQLRWWQRLPLIGALIPGAAGPRAAIRARVDSVIGMLGLEGLAGRKPGQLSGGQRQRVALGRAMVREPAVFLMDEPLSNLDAKLRVQMRTEIAELHRRLGVTFIYVTHDQSEAMTMSDRIAVMMDGVILQVGRPDEIYVDPDDVRVACFVGSPQINLLDGVLRSDRTIELAGIRLTLPLPIDAAPGSRVTVGIRPEQLHEAMGDAGATVSGTIGQTEHLGADILVHLELADGHPPLLARLPVEAHARAAAGMPMRLSLSPLSLLVFDAAGRRLRARATEPAAAGGLA